MYWNIDRLVYLETIDFESNELKWLISFSLCLAGGKYEPVLTDNAYKVHMKLTIKAVTPADFGSYKCVSKNSLGDTDGSIKLYRRSHFTYTVWKV